MQIKETIIRLSRTYYSIQHIQSAAYFTRLGSAIEKVDKPSNPDDFDRLLAEHKACVTSAIFTSAFFLEATINEVFTDAVDYPEGDVKDLEADVKKRMADIWKLEVVKGASFNILHKFYLALSLSGKTLLEPGNHLYDNVRILIDLRNELVHYHPEWITGEGQDKSAKKAFNLEKRLKDKFPLNRLLPSGNPFFPDRCLSHGCAKWTVLSSLAFTDEFFLRMNLPPPYEHVRSRLKVY
jgi:hypothetical protein